jgi:hypothetical protein
MCRPERLILLKGRTQWWPNAVVEQWQSEVSRCSGTLTKTGAAQARAPPAAAPALAALDMFDERGVGRPVAAFFAARPWQ